MVTGRSLLFVCLLAAWLGCEEQLSEDKPTPPDMSEVVRAYESPSAELTMETMPQLLDSLLELIGVSGSLCGWETLEDIQCTNGECSTCEGLEPILELLRTIREQTQNSDSPLVLQDGRLIVREQALDLYGVSIDGEGFMRVKRICNGWGSTPTANEAENGVLNATVGFTDKGLDPIVWGEFTNCRYNLSPEQLFVNGQVRVNFGDQPLGLDDILSSEILVEIIGNVSLGGRDFSGDLHVRIDPGGEIELAIPLEGDYVVFYQNTGGMGFRAANGEWRCDLSLSNCSDGQGNTITW